MANDGFYRTALIGGDPAAVDGIDGDDVVDKDLILAMVSNILYIYEVDADSAAAESSPDVIAFDANGGDKRAVLKAALAGTGASRFPGEIALIGGQIAFPATAVPSADANTLDDYEEGTWTPTGNNTPTSNAGSYEKISRLVTCRGTLTAGSGNLGINVGGLPFTVVNEDAYKGGGITGYQNMTADVVWSVLCIHNTTTFTMRLGSVAQDLTAGKIAQWTIIYPIS